MFIYVLVATFALYILFYYYKNQKRWALAEKIPGPKTVPFIGNALELGTEPHEIFKNINALCEKYGDIHRRYLFHDLVVTITGAKEVEAFLSSTKFNQKPKSYKFFKAWLGNGLYMPTGAEFHNKRKILMHTLNFKVLEDSIPIFSEQSSVLVRQMQKYADTCAEVDVYPYIFLCSLDIICESIVGTKMNAQTESSEYVNALKDISQLIQKRMYKPSISDWTFFFSRDYRRQRRLLKVLHNQSNKVIANCKHDLLDTQRESNAEAGRKNMRLVELLLQMKMNDKPLSDKSVREEIDACLFAGHDTIAAAISFVLFNLAENPHIQEKLFLEIREIFEDDKSRPAYYTELLNMTYLEMVIKESLRLYPSVPLFARRISEDVEIKGYIIPRNTDIFVNVYGMNHRADIFTDPEKFDPERFAPENTTTRPYTCVPFSGGLRSCFGQKFAMMEMKSVISRIIRNFELVSTGHKPKLSMEIVLRSTNGVRLSLQPRKY